MTEPYWMTSASAEAVTPPPWTRLIRLTDDGNIDLDASLSVFPDGEGAGGKVLADWHRTRMCFVPDEGKFGIMRVWNDIIWEEDPQTMLVESLNETFADALTLVVQKIQQQVRAHAARAMEAALVSGRDEKEARKQANADVLHALRPWADHFDYAKRMRNRAARVSTIKESRKHVTRSAAVFDRDLSVFVVRNGVLDLSRGGVLVPHDARRDVTRFADVDYNEHARALLFMRFIEQFLPDPEVRAYLQRVIGMAMLGQPVDKILINLYGPTNTGKSLFLALMRLVFGTGGYYREANVKIFLERRGAAIDPDRAQPALHALRPYRLVGASEPESGAGAKYSESTAKQLTGNDHISTRDNYGHEVEWLPRFVIMIATNDYIRFDVSDDALGERVKIIECMNRVYSADSEDAARGAAVKDQDLLKKIQASEEEKSGILNWALEGLRDYLVGGLREPEDVRRASMVMKAEINSAMEWVTQRIEEGVITRTEGGDKSHPDVVTVSDAMKDYRVWFSDRIVDDGVMPGTTEYYRKMSMAFGRKNFSKSLGAFGSSEKKAVEGGGARGKHFVFDRLLWVSKPEHLTADETSTGAGVRHLWAG